MWGGTEPIGEVWYTGTLGECQAGAAASLLSQTDKAKTLELVADPTDYVMSVDGTALEFYGIEGGRSVFVDDSANPSIYVYLAAQGALFEGHITIKCPIDTTDVEVTVAHK